MIMKIDWPLEGPFLLYNVSPVWWWSEDFTHASFYLMLNKCVLKLKNVERSRTKKNWNWSFVPYCGLLWVIQGDPKLAPPSLDKTRNVPWKLRIAFSNTFYLNIIWRVWEFSTKFRSCFREKCKKGHF